LYDNVFQCFDSEEALLTRAPAVETLWNWQQNPKKKKKKK